MSAGFIFRSATNPRFRAARTAGPVTGTAGPVGRVAAVTVVPHTPGGHRPRRRPVVTAGRRDGQMRPRWAGVPALRPVAVAVVPVSLPATHPGSDSRTDG